jgi:hypothetical protein
MDFQMIRRAYEYHGYHSGSNYFAGQAGILLFAFEFLFTVKETHGLTLLRRSHIKTIVSPWIG